MNNMLGSPILRWSMGAWEAHGDAMTDEESAGSRIVKFTPIVALNTFDGATELGFNISKEIWHCLKGVRFKVKWKGPKILWAIIKNDKIILVTGNTQN
jgi:hypothetical protein